MIQVLVARYSCADSCLLIDEYLSVLPASLLTKFNGFYHKRDACLFLLGKLLLKEGLHILGITDLSLEMLKFSAYNKPFFEGGPSFSTSHSGDYVVCVLSPDQTLGVDIEEIVNLELNQFSSCFSYREYNSIMASHLPLQLFFHYWTRKEAILKAVGRGLGHSLNSLDVVDNAVWLTGKRWCLQKLDIAENYICHLAATNLTDDRYSVSLHHFPAK